MMQVKNAERIARTCIRHPRGENIPMKALYNDGSVAELPQDEVTHVIRHSAAHIMAQAIKRLYPEADFAYGPATDNGFYYDVDLPEGVKISEDDFPAIEAEMKKIVKENLKFTVYEKPRAEAIALMEERGEKYKVEHIGDLDDDARITFYQQGDYIDMCVGPHICYTKALKAFKLTGVSGAYWKGDKDNKMLTRINGVAFATKEELDEHMHMLEEAKKRDHRKIGREMDLFMMRDEAPGFPFFLPNGMILKNTLLDYWREIHHKAGYVEISTPLIMNKQLWKTSGHWDHYKDNMYSTVIDDEEYCIKPMNCPGGVLVYASKPHSYRELPIRAGEIGLVHRHELRGALHGLFRVRCFTQDDAHIFMMPEQIKDVIQETIRLFDEVYATFGLKYHAELSTRPDDSMGDDETWEKATNGLKAAMEDFGLPYTVNEGDGAFYGPKIDFHLTDSIGRTWQCGTIQLDMLLPEKFDLTYTGEDGLKHRPVMIHRVAYGSIERFIGILIEHYAGAFPAWLAPCQVRILPITDKQHDYAQKLYDKMFKLGLRVHVDDRNEKIGYKIREAQMQKTPYMLVIGEKEVENGTVAVRRRGEGDIGAMNQDEFIAMLQKEIAEKK